MHIATSNLLWNLNDCIKKKKKDLSSNFIVVISKDILIVKRIFKNIQVFLNFTSNLIVDVLGNEGRHSRVAIGVSSFPKILQLKLKVFFYFIN